MAKKPKILGVLPVEIIKLTLQKDLEVGDIVLGELAEQHAKSRHPQDFDICLPLLATILENPMYCGEDDAHDQKISLVGRIPSSMSDMCLIAVSLEHRTARGGYNVHSFYRMTQREAAYKQRTGRLQIAKRPPPKRPSE